MKTTSISIVTAAAFLAIAATPSMAGLADVNNTADILHPNIHDKVGDGSNANPSGNNPNGGAEIHGIGNTPGQNGTNPNDDGVAGFANQLNNVHGGIGTVNKNVGKLP